MKRERAFLASGTAGAKASSEGSTGHLWTRGEVGVAGEQRRTRGELFAIGLQRRIESDYADPCGTGKGI